MTVALLGLALMSAAYKFEPATSHQFQVDVTFDGFLPVLGGNEGVVDAKMGLAVSGLSPKESNLRATSELNSFELSFNKAKLPFDLSSAEEYFPKTTISLTPAGKIVENNAPDKQLMVRLPGLDVKRFPDITYAPLEFPETGIETGTTWNFTKKFDGADVFYTCTVKNMTDTQAEVSVSVKQTFDSMENEALEIVKSESDAVNRVKTDMTGTGVVLFNLEKGIPNKVVMTNDSASTVTPIKGGASTVRKLKTTLRLLRSGFSESLTGAKPAPPANWQNQLGLWWDSAVQTGQSWWNQAGGYLAMAKMALAMMFSGTPLPFSLPGFLGGK
jgi:hypothetical protein